MDSPGMAIVSVDADGKWTSISFEPPDAKSVLITRDYLLDLVMHIYPGITVKP